VSSCGRACPGIVTQCLRHHAMRYQLQQPANYTNSCCQLSNIGPRVKPGEFHSGCADCIRVCSCALQAAGMPKKLIINQRCRNLGRTRLDKAGLPEPEAPESDAAEPQEAAVMRPKKLRPNTVSWTLRRARRTAACCVNCCHSCCALATLSLALLNNSPDNAALANKLQGKGAHSTHDLLAETPLCVAAAIHRWAKLP
jgi:hypothetical protein